MTSPRLSHLLETASRDGRILAVLLYGSEARGESRPDSDTDVCLVLQPGAESNGAQAHLDYLGFAPLDVRVFQRLPIYIRHRVLKDAQVLLVKNEEELYEVAFRTIREWEDFRPFYLEYLEQTANG